MNEDQPWEFTCITCGGHKLTVYRIWKILAGPDSETWQEWGPLEANHLWRFEFKEKIENNKDDEIEQRDLVEYAKDDSYSRPEEYEIYEPEDNPGNDKFYVNCASCDREIEFGWSRSNREGGIFPVECSDFIPGKYWPEPRYLDSWQKKGWLQHGIRSAMIKSENHTLVEMHGCIVCARSFNILAVYTPEGRLVDCAVTDPGGHCIPNKGQPLAACDIHSAEEIDRAYQRWKTRNDIPVDEPDE